MANINNVSFTDYGTEQAAIQRRTKLAEMLLQQGLTPPPATESIGGWAIQRSPWEGVAKIAQAGVGAYGLRKEEERAKALAERIRGDRTADYSTLAAGMQGTPAQPAEVLPDDMAGPPRPEQPATIGGQISPALINQLRTPEAQAIATKMLMDQQKPTSIGSGGLRLGNGQIIPPAARPDTGFTLSPDQVRYGPNNQPIATAPAKIEKPDALTSALVNAGIDPKSPEAQALFMAHAQKIATHQPPTKVNVATNVSTEKKYGEQFAGQIAQADSAMRDAAAKAPDLASRANMIKKILSESSPITGFGADFRLQFGKAAALAGIGSSNDVAANTEILAASLAQNTMDAIKASGMGGGTGFSNADRDFLEKAKGGRITLEPAAIDRLATLAHRAANQSAENWSKRVKEIPKSAIEGTGISAESVAIEPLYNGRSATNTGKKPAKSGVVKWGDLN